MSQRFAASVLITSALLCVVGISVYQWGPIHTNDISVRVPALGDVNSISVTVYSSPTLGIAEIREFIIPSKYIPVIIGAITPAKQAAYRIRDGWTYAEIRIVTKDGRITSLLLHEVGDNPAAFTINGMRCLRSGPYRPNMVYNHTGDHYLDESNTLYEIIKLIHQNDHEAAAELQLYIEELERSRGARPPRME